MYLIFPNDPSTDFLKEVINHSLELFPEINLVECHASDDSYTATKDFLATIPEGRTIFFIGHGSLDSLYGGASHEVEKRPLITLKNINLFKNSNLILMACNSTGFLESSRQMRNFSDGLGFGLLPSEMGELQVNRKIREIELAENDLDKFKEILITLFKKIISKVAKGEHSIESLATFVSTYISKLINELVKDKSMVKVAKLLFYVKKDLISG